METASSEVRQTVLRWRGIPVPSWAPAALIIGATAALFAFTAREYFTPSDYVGWRQIFVMLACVGAIATGAALEVITGQARLSQALRFWGVAGIIIAVVVALATYQIQTRAFYGFVAPLTCAGFIINHYLPARWRMSFLLSLALLTIVGVFGVANAAAAAALTGIALALIAICHLPIPLWGRIGLLLAVAAGLAALRVNWVYISWLNSIVPILASVFMFRLAIYLYDIESGKGPKDWPTRLSYFFLFPNFVFPFFPTIDFSTYGRSYRNDDALKIYWRGADYIVRGLVHLLIYRFISTYCVLVSDEINNGLTFLQHIVSNFGLYFRISGMFHLIAGMIALFGFNLPETHTRFYFANSFTDFWRRINIYWKDFMQKMVFTPSYMQLKKFGLKHISALVVSMAVVFILTWALHAYQWFWLTGTSLFTLTDMLFWAVLGGFLIVQTLLEERPRRKAAGFVPPQVFLVIRTVCTFLTICLLWSFWTSHSVGDWLSLVARSGLTPALFDPQTAGAAAWLQTALVLALTGFMIAITTGVTFGLPAPSAPAKRAAARKAADPLPGIAGFATLASIVVGLLALQQPTLRATLGEQASTFVSEMAMADGSRGNIAMMDRGYYEGVAGARGGFNRELDEMFSPRPQAENAAANPGMRLREDYLGREWAPNGVATVAGVTFPINSQGMYDQYYEQQKPADAFRIALIGDSRGMGWGVAESARFETILEDRLNRDHAGGAYQRYEILNFSVYGYEPTERLMVFENTALNFAPDAIIYIGGLLDFSLDHFAQMVRAGRTMPYPFLDEIIAEAGIRPSQSNAEIIRRAEPYRARIQEQVYNRFGELMRGRGVTGVWVEIPSISDRRHDIPAMVARAGQAGFHTLDLSGVYDPQTYRLSRWDGHPSPEGHRFIADRIYEYLKERDESGAIDMGLSASTAKP